MSIRAFAAHLGVSVSAVLNWEGRGSAVRLRTETQQMLDVDLARCESEIQQRFTAILAGGNAAKQPSSDLAHPPPRRTERAPTVLSAHDDP
jgi:hypothetical protein